MAIFESLFPRIKQARDEEELARLAKLKTITDIQQTQQENTPLYQTAGLPSQDQELDIAKKYLDAQTNPVPPQAAFGSMPAYPGTTAAVESATGKPGISPYVSFDENRGLGNSREEIAKQFNVPIPALNLTPKQLTQTGSAFKNFTPKVVDPTKKTIAETLPSMTDDEISTTFGKGVTRDTPFVIANALRSGNIKQEKGKTLFPVAALAPEAQVAAQRAGLGQFVTETQARILNAGNLPRPATTEEIQQIAKQGNIQEDMNNIRQLAKETNYEGIGIDKYYQNYLGQYIPIDSLKTDPKIVSLYRYLNQVNNQLIYLYSGKQINESEYKRLLATFPDPRLNPEAFIARLDDFEREFQKYSKRFEQGMTGAGRRFATEGNQKKEILSKPIPVNSEAEAEALPNGSRFILNGKTGTVHK